MKRTCPRHPKVDDLAARLKVPRYAAVGLLELLWHFTAEFARPGDVGRFSDQAIAAALSWDGDESMLVSSLHHAGWLDACCQQHRFRVHDWPDHADQTVQRVLLKQNQHFLSCYDNASTVLAPSKDETSQPKASTKPIALPKAKPEPIPDAGSESGIEPPPGFPADEAAAVFTAEAAGVPAAFARTAWNTAVGRGYKDSKGNRIHNWWSFVKGAFGIHQNIEAEKKTNGTYQRNHRPVVDRNAGTANEGQPEYDMAHLNAKQAAKIAASTERNAPNALL